MGTSEGDLINPDHAALKALIVSCVGAGQPVPDWVREAYEHAVRGEVGEHRTHDYAIARDWVPDEVADWQADLLEGFVSPARIEALEDGAPATPSETALWRREWLRKVLDNDDADQAAVICYVPLEGPEGDECICLATLTGYSFSGLEVTFHGFFDSEWEADKYLRATHYTTVDDLDGLPEFKGVRSVSYDPDAEDDDRKATAALTADESTTECPLCRRPNTLSAGRACAHAIVFVRKAKFYVVAGQFGAQSIMGRLENAWAGCDRSRARLDAKEVERRLQAVNLPDSSVALARMTEFRYLIESLPFAQVVTGQPGARDVYLEPGRVAELQNLARDLESAARAFAISG